MGPALALGALQGFLEWLPISSEGFVALAGTLMGGLGPREAVAYALWLHVGTALAVPLALPREVGLLLRTLRGRAPEGRPLLAFLAGATLVSGGVGGPLLVLLLPRLPLRDARALALALGLLLLVTALFQAAGRRGGRPHRSRPGPLDALLVGAAQGLAVLPGLSRSGLTVSVLLMRGFGQGEALRLSFLLAVPALLGAALAGGLQADPLALAPAGLAAAGVSGAVGALTLRALLALVPRVPWAWLLGLVGAGLVLGALLLPA